MKILVDCSTAGMGGARTYLECFVKTLKEFQRKGDAWIIYGPPACWAAPSSGPGVELREIPSVYSTPIGYLGWLTAVLPKIVRKEGVDVVFSATGFGMFRPPCPQLLLVRNPIYFSRLYASMIRGIGWRLEVALRRRLSLYMIRRSDRVIFPTRAMRDLVADHVSLEEGKYVIAPYGCDVDLFQKGDGDPAALPEALSSVSGRFLLNVSHYCAQKNFTVLFETLSVLRRRGAAPTLALTTRLGPAPNCTYQKDRAILYREHLEGQVVQLGPIPRNRLPGLYRSAGLFVFPSYVESFGHPLVEAMASGLCIVAADTPVNREICGPAAVYAAPFDAGDWAEKILQGLQDVDLRKKLQENARSQVQRFSWQRHLEIIQAAARESLAAKGVSP